ncbi:MAG: hypothetical protein NT031_03380 [Planctomycetota bacterium]|nr:hypothetical protein [Planctomycetota bacterium]
MEKSLKRQVKNIGWYVAYTRILDVDEMEDVANGNRSWTGRVWGWDCGSGVASLVLGISAAVTLCTMMSSKMLRGWTWIGLFAAALMGVPVFVLSLIWILVCPSENISPVLSQGACAGPFLAMVGGLVLAGISFAGGAAGLQAFARDAAQRVGDAKGR